MRSYLLLSFVCLCCIDVVYARPSASHAVYVDYGRGNDSNSGTIDAPLQSIQRAAELIRSRDNDVYTARINPGIYILDRPVIVSTEKNMTGKRIVIEASILPDDSSWTPEKMPVIISRAKTGEVSSGDTFLKDDFITDFYVDESHVTIRGLKFHGCYYNRFFYPISRFNKSRSDLSVEQCMFLGDKQTSVIQASIIAHGDSVRVDHCVFYNANNSVVYWHNSGHGIKTGNSMTYCIIYGASGSAVYTCYADKDFVFKNNVVSNSKIFWSICPRYNNAKYSLDSCVIVNCKIYQADGEKPIKFELSETNVIKEGEISLRMSNAVWEPLPKDHLHVIRGTLGYDLGAGLFKNRER